MTSSKASRIVQLAACVAALGLLATGCGGSSSSSSGSIGNGVVAVVNGEEITQEQLDALVEGALNRQKATGQKVPTAGSQEYQALQQSAVQYLVQRAELEQGAAKLGVTVTDKQVGDKIAQLVKQNYGGSEKRYLNALKQAGMTDEEWRYLEEGRLLGNAVYAKVSGAATVSDAEVRAYYAANRQQYVQPASRVVRLILVPSKQLAEKLRSKLAGGADFAALARKYSTDPASKAVGGKLTVQKGSYQPPFEKVVFSLKTKQISAPVKTVYGWNVIQALGPRTPQKTAPLSEKREAIRQQLLSKKRAEAAQRWYDDLKKAYSKKIKYAPGLAPPTQTSPTTTG